MLLLLVQHEFWRRNRSQALVQVQVEHEILSQEVVQLKDALEMLQMDRASEVKLLREQLDEVRADLKAVKMGEAAKAGANNEDAETIAFLEADRRMLMQEVLGLRQWLETPPQGFNR